jgi:hypothetical protein
MKCLFSVATLLLTLVSAASNHKSIRKRSQVYVVDQIYPTFIFVLDQTVSQPAATTNDVVISSTGNSDIKMSLASFLVPPYNSIPGADSTTICDLLIVNPRVDTGEQIFNLGMLTQEIYANGSYTFGGPDTGSSFLSTLVPTITGDTPGYISDPFNCPFDSNFQISVTPTGVADLEFFQMETQYTTSGFILQVYIQDD